MRQCIISISPSHSSHPQIQYSVMLDLVTVWLQSAAWKHTQLGMFVIKPLLRSLVRKIRESLLLDMTRFMKNVNLPVERRV
jgi:hypothetical protein